MIDINELADVCEKYGLPVEKEMMQALMIACNADCESGEIDYLSFINFLNWKDKMPLGIPQNSERRK